jgi:hypothetical protein
VADYCTLNELKASLRITDNVDNGLLRMAITSASGWIDSYCGRQFAAAGTAVEDRVFVATGRYEVLPIDDAVEITQVAIDDDLDESFSEVLRPIDFQAEPLNSLAGALPFPFYQLRPQEDGYWPTYSITPGRATVKVSARWGWPATPDVVKNATILQAARLFSRYNSPLGVAGVGDMGAIRVSRFADPDVQLLLGPYRRINL